MKHTFLFIFLAVATICYSQNPFDSDKIVVCVSDAHDKPLDAKVEIVGLPQIIFEEGENNDRYNAYYIEEDEYPKKKDTVYYLKITVAGFPEKRVPLSAPTTAVYMFQPGEKYVYEGFSNVPAYYNNLYLACFSSDSALVTSFCKKHKLQIVNRYTYCDDNRNGVSKNGKPDTYIIQKTMEGGYFEEVDTVLAIFRKTFPNNGGAFYYTGGKADFLKSALRVMIVYANKIDVALPSDVTNTKLIDYINKTVGASYTNYSEMRGTWHYGVEITLPLSWNISKVNKFIDGLMQLGILGAGVTSSKGMECPN